MDMFQTTTHTSANKQLKHKPVSDFSKAKTTGCCVCVVRVAFYVQISGITTGLSCATQVAKAFMLSFDLEVHRVVHSDLLLYKRLVVDDVLVVVHDVNNSQFLSLFNSWCPGIVIKNDGVHAVGQLTTFLDDYLRIDRSMISYRTDRKPLNGCAYVPYCINHALATKRGMIAT